jgi:HK97 family phage major capsid protein
MDEKILVELSDGIKAIREKYEALETKNVSFETKQSETKETIDRILKKLDELEIERKRAAIHAFTGDKKERSPEFKAYLDWLRTGNPIPAEMKVMRVSDQTLGGYLATPEITNELLKDIVEYSPIRSIARVRPTSKESIQFRKRTGKFSARWTGETSTKTETTGWKVGLETIPTHEAYAQVDISNWDLEDSDFNLEAELQLEFSEQFGVAEGEVFISGNGIAKPEGILSSSQIGEVVSGDASKITADGLFRLYFAPKTIYAKNARFIMNRQTMLEVSILKDDVKQYLLRRLGESPVWSILGAEVVECPDMPNIASGSYPVAFGDFKKGYIIADRLTLSVLRDPYTAAENNSVRFHARKRVGGQVIMPEAIKKLKIAAA